MADNTNMVLNPKFVFTCFGETRTWILMNPYYFQGMPDASAFANNSGFNTILKNVYANRFEMLRRLVTVSRNEFIRNLATYGMDLSGRPSIEQVRFKNMIDGVFGEFLRELIAPVLNTSEVQEDSVEEEKITELEPFPDTSVAVEDQSSFISTVSKEVDNEPVAEPKVEGLACYAPERREADRMAVECYRLRRCLDKQHKDMQCLFNSRVKPFSSTNYEDQRCRLLLKALLIETPGRMDCEWGRDNGKGTRFKFRVPSDKRMDYLWGLVSGGNSLGELTDAYVKYLLLCLGYGHKGFGKGADLKVSPDFPVTAAKILRRQAFKWPMQAFDLVGKRCYLQHLFCDHQPYAFFVKVLSEAVLCNGSYGFDADFGFYIEKVKRQPWYSSDDFLDWEELYQPIQ